jgi:hypothetical protein
LFPTSRDEVIPREKARTIAQKIMSTIFFNGVNLITLNALLHGAQFDQEYFVHHILPDISESRG